MNARNNLKYDNCGKYFKISESDNEIAVCNMCNLYHPHHCHTLLWLQDKVEKERK